MTISKELSSFVANSYPLRHFWEQESEPLFVMGNQKSGTTVIADLLAQASAKTITNDFSIRFGSYEPFYSLLEGNLSLDQFLISKRYEFSREILKEPNLTLMMDQLVNAYIHSSFLFIVRHPIENITSILSRLSISGSYTPESICADVSINGIWENILLGRDLQLIKYPKHNSDMIAQVGSVIHLADRWKYMVNRYQANIKSVRFVKYEDFCNDKVGTINSLLTALELPQRGRFEHLVSKQYQVKKESKDATLYLSAKQIDFFNDYLQDEMEFFDYKRILSS